MPIDLHGFPLINVNGTLWIIGGSDQTRAEKNQGREEPGARAALGASAMTLLILPLLL